jgi:hypothetical protein
MSASLKHPGAHLWLSEMFEASALLSAILRVIHPALYECGRETIQRLHQHAELQPALEKWPSVFNAVTILSNRETPLHRDNHSRPQWYDMLTPVGPYQQAVLDLPGVGLKLAYESGTVVGLSGKVLRHGVKACDGERICLAYYMRDKVHERMGTEAGQWMKHQHYENV